MNDYHRATINTFRAESRSPSDKIMSSNPLNYHHLLYFWAVAKKGSVKLASQSLHVSQPSISTQLKQLEGCLATPLVARMSRSLVLIDTGPTVLEYAVEIFSLRHELFTAVHQHHGR